MLDSIASVHTGRVLTLRYLQIEPYFIRSKYGCASNCVALVAKTKGSDRNHDI